ncbi:MAG: hypothetical protein JXN61_02810, partial [Sedimentisphaerales bacterium]|nr:hypothetical protein [Sedimentisphaerales bacterium]
CWFYPRQCHGDSDNMKEGGPKAGYFYVHYYDLNLLTTCWNISEPPAGPGFASVPGCICADFAHDLEGGPKSGYFRVHYNDLNILMDNWSIAEPPTGPGIPPDCLECVGDGKSAGGEKEAVVAEPVDVEKLLDWLAEIWLDPEVREHIDAEAWLKMYESIKALE